MRKIFWILWTLLCTMPLARAQAQHEELAKRLKQHAFVLADDSLRGRKTGTVYAQKAANYISRQLQAMGARPYSDTSYEFPFTYRSGTQKGMNLLVLFPGTDPELKEEYIVLGAHYDHIGTTLSPSSDYIYNWADDNASGSSVLLELTRMLLAHPEQLKRSVLVAFFDAEEVGLEGSTYLANHFVVPVEQVKLMMSIEMVGYLRTSGFLEYSGYGTIADGKRLIGGLPWNAPYGKVKLKEFENSIFTATDTRGFAQKGCPTLAVSTGLKSPYHKVNDEAEGLDLDGMAYVTEHLGDQGGFRSAVRPFRQGGLHPPYGGGSLFADGLQPDGAVGFRPFVAGGQRAGRFQQVCLRVDGRVEHLPDRQVRTWAWRRLRQLGFGLHAATVLPLPCAGGAFAHPIQHVEYGYRELLSQIWLFCGALLPLSIYRKLEKQAGGRNQKLE